VAFTWPVKTVSRELSEVRKPEVRLQQLEVFSEVFEGFSSALLELVTYGPIGTNQARVNELREAAKFAYLPVKEFVTPYLKNSPNPLDHLVFGITEVWSQPILGQKIDIAKEALSIYGQHLRYLISKSE
jgi:hypothetical protein